MDDWSTYTPPLPPRKKAALIRAYILNPLGFPLKKAKVMKNPIFLAGPTLRGSGGGLGLGPTLQVLRLVDEIMSLTLIEARDKNGGCKNR